MGLEHSKAFDDKVMNRAFRTPLAREFQSGRGLWPQQLLMRYPIANCESGHRGREMAPEGPTQRAYRHCVALPDIAATRPQQLKSLA